MKHQTPAPILFRCLTCGEGFSSKYAAKRHRWVCMPQPNKGPEHAR